MCDSPKVITSHTVYEVANLPALYDMLLHFAVSSVCFERELNVSKMIVLTV